MLYYQCKTYSKSEALLYLRPTRSVEYKKLGTVRRQSLRKTRAQWSICFPRRKFRGDFPAYRNQMKENSANFTEAAQLYMRDNLSKLTPSIHFSNASDYRMSSLRITQRSDRMRRTHATTGPLVKRKIILFETIFKQKHEWTQGKTKMQLIYAYCPALILYNKSNSIEKYRYK